MLAVLANLSLPAPLHPQSMSATLAVAASDGFICTAHAGLSDHTPPAPDKQDCECPFCVLCDGSADGGRTFFPIVSTALAPPSSSLAVNWPDFIPNGRGLILGAANRARAPPHTLPTA